MEFDYRVFGVGKTGRETLSSPPPSLSRAASRLEEEGAKRPREAIERLTNRHWR